jgi:hypothetical protein
MNRLLTSVAVTIVITIALWLGNSLAGDIETVQAAQCWEPGCCGFTLVYNQWSCVSAESAGLCRDTGEEPTWVCNSTGGTNTDEQACREECNGVPCEWRCPVSEWGNHCVITSGNVACQHPNESTCTANVYAIQCQSMAGVNDCNSSVSPLDVRQCWVSGGLSPIPGRSV